MLTTTNNEALFNQFGKTTDYSVVAGKSYYKKNNGIYTLYTVAENTILVKYYEKDSSKNYFQTEDSDPVAGKTYYKTNDYGEYKEIETTGLPFLTLYTVVTEFVLPFKYYNNNDMTVYGVSKEDAIPLDTNVTYKVFDTTGKLPYTYDLTKDTTAIEYSITQDVTPFEYVRAKLSFLFERINDLSETGYHYTYTQDSILDTSKTYYVYSPENSTYYRYNTLYIKNGSIYTEVTDIYSISSDNEYYTKENNIYLKIQVEGYGYEKALEGTDYYFTPDGSVYTNVDDPFSCFTCLRSFYYVKKGNNKSYYTRDVDGNYHEIPSNHHYEKIQLINEKDKTPSEEKYRYVLTTDKKFVPGKQYYKKVNDSYVLDKAIYDTTPSITTDERFSSNKEYLLKNGNNYTIEDVSNLIGQSIKYYKNNLSNLPLNYVTKASEVYYEKVDSIFTEIKLAPGTEVKQINYYKSNVLSRVVKGEIINAYTVYYEKVDNNFVVAQLKQGTEVTEENKYYKGFFTKTDSLSDNTLYYRYNSNSGIYVKQDAVALKDYYTGIVPTSDTSYAVGKVYYTKENNVYTVTSNSGNIEVADNREIPGNVLLHNGFDSDTTYYEKGYNTKDYYKKEDDEYIKVDNKDLPAEFPTNTYYEKNAITKVLYTLNSSTGDYEVVNNDDLKTSGWKEGEIYYTKHDALISVPKYDQAIKDNKFYFTKSSFNQGCYKYTTEESSFDTSHPLYFYRVESDNNNITLYHTEDISYRDMCIGDASATVAYAITLDGQVKKVTSASASDLVSLDSAYSWIAIFCYNNESLYALSKEGYLATINIATKEYSIKHQFGIKGKDWQDLFYKDDLFYLLSASGKLMVYASNREFREIQLNDTAYWKAFFIHNSHVCALATHGYYYDIEEEKYYQLSGTYIQEATEYSVATFTTPNSTLYFWKDYEALYAKRDTSLTQPETLKSNYEAKDIENVFDRAAAMVQDLNVSDNSDEVSHAVSADGIRVEVSQDNQTYYPTFADGEGEIRTLFVDGDKTFAYTPSTNTLTVDSLKVNNLEATSLKAKVDGEIERAQMLSSDPRHNTRAGEQTLNLGSDTPYIKVPTSQTEPVEGILYYYSTDLTKVTTKVEGEIYYYLSEFTSSTLDPNTTYYHKHSENTYVIIDNNRYKTGDIIYVAKEDTTGKKPNVYSKGLVQKSVAAVTPDFTTPVQYYAIPYENNTALGYQAGLNNKSGSNNIYVGVNVLGIDGENNVIRIGNSSQAFYMLNEAKFTYASSKLTCDKPFTAPEVYGAVWNDLVDAISVPEDTELEYGYCYATDGKKYWKTKKRNERGTIGIHSDTCGFGMGMKEGKALWCAVAGFVLAHVDKIYPTGTALTSAPNGLLTKMKLLERILHPERVVGKFWKEEKNPNWGSKTRTVQVNGRSWVKVN